MADLPKRVALVYDRVNKWGGAEQVLLALHEIFPQAPLHTAVYNPATAGWAKVFPQVIPSFLQSFPLAKSHHELYPWLTPLAFESFKFVQYEAVISVTSSDAKGIITQPGTFHLCYCLTPTRYLWTHPVPILDFLKSWDLLSSRRPDAYLAISNTVKDRIRKYYSQDSTIIHPPVSIEKYSALNHKPITNNYFLWVGRLVYHKRPDLLIRLFNELSLPLVIAGTGRMEPSLRHIAKKNIRFTGFVSQSELVSLYQNASAFVSVHEEDFGIAYIEAQASGLPIVALNTGAVAEIVSPSSGHLANSFDEFKSIVKNFDSRKFDHKAIKQAALRFSKERFNMEFVKVFANEWTKYKNIYSS